MESNQNTKALVNLDWQKILEKLASFASSELAKSSLLNLNTFQTPELAQENMNTILSFQRILLQGIRPRMESLDLCEIWLQRIKKEAVLKTLELRDVRHFCIETLELKSALDLCPHDEFLQNLSSQLMDASRPLSAIDQIMTPDGEIRSDASETLFRLFRERQHQVQAVQNILDKLVHQHDLDPILQERYVTNREGRWVLPVKSGMQHHFEGIIHSSSQTKQTVFMEPKEIIPLNNRLRQIEVDIEEEIERLLEQLSIFLVSIVHDFEDSKKLLLKSDLMLAQANLSQILEAEPIVFSKERLHLKNLRHPGLVFGSQPVIPNDVELDLRNRILLLSGPNAGGKTVLLKAVGLAAQMARCGLTVCASEGSELPFFNHLYVAIGDAQSVDAQLSTFAAHLKILDQATTARGSEDLLLIDEICGSTDPEEGSALARSFIDTYSKIGVFGVITSHLSPLKTGWSDSSGVINGSLEYNSKSGLPTYQFLMGVPGQSLAIQTARRVGVKTEIIEKALLNLSPEAKKYQESLGQMESLKEELHSLKSEMERKIKEAQKEKSKYQELYQKLESEKDHLLNKAVRKAEKKIDELIDFSRVDQVFKRHEKLQSAKFELPQIVKAPAQGSRSSPKMESIEDFAKAFPPGSKVYLSSLGRDAVIQSQPNQRGEIQVLANSMLLTVPWTQLKPPESTQRPLTSGSSKSDSPKINSFDLDRSLDLRGLPLETALQRLEAHLDQAALHQEDRIKIVHGHGTESLKRGIRSYLSRSVYVKKWLSGTPETGGDGVTWVELL